MIMEMRGLKINHREKKFRDTHLIKGIFEFDMYENFLLKSEDKVLDLGGYIGLFALYAHNKVKEIVSYEPDNESADLYTKNMIENNITNYKLMRLAVVENDDKERIINKLPVKCTNINDVLKSGNFNKIRIDIEGSEYEIIKSINSFEGIDSLVMEFHIKKPKDHTLNKYTEVLQILRDNFKYVEILNIYSIYMSTLTIICTNTKKKIISRSLFDFED